MLVRVYSKRLKLLCLQAVVFAERYSDFVLKRGLIFYEVFFFLFFLKMLVVISYFEKSVTANAYK